MSSTPSPSSPRDRAAVGSTAELSRENHDCTGREQRDKSGRARQPEHRGLTGLMDTKKSGIPRHHGCADPLGMAAESLGTRDEPYANARKNEPGDLKWPGKSLRKKSEYCGNAGSQNCRQARSVPCFQSTVPIKDGERESAKQTRTNRPLQILFRWKCRVKNQSENEHHCRPAEVGDGGQQKGVGFPRSIPTDKIAHAPCKSRGKRRTSGNELVRDKQGG